MKLWTEHILEVDCFPVIYVYILVQTTPVTYFPSIHIGYTNNAIKLKLCFTVWQSYWYTDLYWLILHFLELRHTSQLVLNLYVYILKISLCLRLISDHLLIQRQLISACYNQLSIWTTSYSTTFYSTISIGNLTTLS